MRMSNPAPPGLTIPLSRHVAHAIAHPSIPRPITLGTLSIATGIDRSYLSKVLTGMQKPGFHVARAMAVGLGLTLDELFHGLESQLQDTAAWSNAQHYGVTLGLQRRPEKLDVQGPARPSHVLQQREEAKRKVNNGSR